MSVTRAETLLDAAFLEDWVGRYAAAWERLRDHRDPEPLLSMYTADVRYHDPGSPVDLLGHDAVRAFLRTIVRAFPDISYVVLDSAYPSPTGPRAMVPFRMTFTMLGDLPTHRVAPTGASMTVEGVTTWEFAGPLARRYATYFDNWDVATQLGIVPDPATVLGRVMSGAQHARAAIQRRAAARRRARR